MGGPKNNKRIALTFNLNHFQTILVTYQDTASNYVGKYWTILGIIKQYLGT